MMKRISQLISSPRILYPFIFLLAFLIRFLFYLKFPHIETPDVSTYFDSGKFLFEAGKIPDGRVMPLFPALSYSAGSSIRLLGIFISSGSAVISAFLAKNIFKDSWTALLSGLIFCLYPYFIYFSVVPITETLFVFLFLLGLLCLFSHRPFWTSVIWTLSILVRPTLDYLAPIAIFIYVLSWRKSLREAFKSLGIYFLIYVLLMSPWWMHNFQKYNQFIRLNTGSGLVLYAGNVNMANEGWFLSPAGENLTYPLEIQAMTDLEANRYLTDKTIQFISENPGKFLKIIAIKFFRFWKPFPDPTNYGRSLSLLGVALASSFFLFIGAFYSLKRRQDWRRGDWQIIMLIVFYFTAIHVLTIANIRYRLPIDAVLTVAAAHGWRLLIGKKL